MSRIIRRQIFSTLDEMCKTHRIIEEKTESIEQDKVNALLAECQDNAIMIANQIEAIYGGGLECISHLEKYCETIYHIVEFFDNPGIRIENIALAIVQLEQLRTSMEKEIPDRLEVVFFPYKASMWDSLESIYLAACKDEECDVYCVPIPYYDLNPDKSFCRFYDESEEYPESIAVQDWKEYEFELRKPDIIFIHNPYDNWNAVTSVEPRFYAKNLRKYTEKLVYIPYFVLDDIKTDDQKAIEQIKHFCFLPGVIYADKVIVQSENMRMIYLAEYAKEAEREGIPINRATLSDKILGLGSPKFDKISKNERGDYSIPEKWQKIIIKPDGQRKKIILYNIAIRALLTAGEMMLKKVRSVLEFFEVKQDEVVLWWRPHPLIQSTIKAMRPELWNEYIEIVSKYKSECWGIYDDTVEFERSIACTDAYYGDVSSVVRLYHRTGKPSVVQDWNRTELERVKEDYEQILRQWKIEDETERRVHHDFMATGLENEKSIGERIFESLR